MRDIQKECEVCDAPMRVDKDGEVYCNCPMFRVRWVSRKTTTEKLPSEQFEL